MYIWRGSSRTARVKKTSRGQSFAESHAYNPIRDSLRDSVFYAGDFPSPMANGGEVIFDPSINQSPITRSFRDFDENLAKINSFHNNNR